MPNPLDPTIKENWQYHDEYDFWYMPYPGTNEAQAEEGVRWRGFKPWEKATKRESIGADNQIKRIKHILANEDTYDECVRKIEDVLAYHPPVPISAKIGDQAP